MATLTPTLDYNTVTGSQAVPQRLSYFPRTSGLGRRNQRIRETNSGSTSEQCAIITDDDKEVLVEKIASFNRYGDTRSLLSLDTSLQLKLTLEAIKRNAGNPYVWGIRREILDGVRTRREILDGVPHYLSIELDTIMALPIEFNHKNVWQHRLWLARSLGDDAMFKEFKHTIDHLSQNPKDSDAWSNLNNLTSNVGAEVLAAEFNLLKKIITEDNENHHAWYHLCEMTEKFDKTTARHQLKGVIDFLKEKQKHESAWSYLYRIAAKFNADCIMDAMKFMDDAICNDAWNCFAWTYRRMIEAWTYVGLSKEVEFTENILLVEAMNNYAWYYRRWLLENIASMGKVGTDDVKDIENAFTKKILSEEKNANNAYAWYQRKWLLEACGGWEDELEYCIAFLKNDIDNEYAWQQRSFIVLSLELGDEDELRISEVQDATKAICMNPKNRFVWMYLQSLYIPTPFDDSNLKTLFEFVYGVGFLGAHDESRSLQTLLCLISLGYTPSNEMDDFSSNSFLRNKRKRSMLGEELGANAGGVQHEITKEIIFKDPSIKYAWSQRKSLLESLHGWESELAFCDQLIQANKFSGSDEFAWDQRYFVVGKSDQVQVEAEALYAKSVILAAPENKHAWTYLTCMFKQMKFDREEKTMFEEEVLDDLFMTVFGAKDDGLKKYMCNRRIVINELQMNIIMNRTKFINALEALMDLLCLGYGATGGIFLAIQLLKPGIHGGPEFLDHVSSILEFAYPVGVRYWRWRVEHTRKMSPMCL
ncbi:hypothetical protein OROGR_000590 [Orobanche gracilis]